MSRKFNENIVNVYGDTIESCMYSRILAENSNKKIIHHYSEQLGGIYSTTGMLGLLTGKQVKKIKEFLPEEEFIIITETYVKIPYNKLKIKNGTDGNIRFPLTKKSFESEYDYEDTIINTYTYQEYVEKYKESKNITKVFKSIFQDNFYIDVVKKVGSNLFNVIQTQMDYRYLYKTLLNLDSLEQDEIYQFYLPVCGFEKLCFKLLEKENITVVNQSRIDVKNKFRDNFELNYLFEFADYYFDFVYGALDYIKYEVTPYKTTLYNTEEISKVYTPYDKKHGLYFQIDNVIYSVDANKTRIRSNNFGKITIMPTLDNCKKNSQYVELANNIPNVKIIA